MVTAVIATVGLTGGSYVHSRILAAEAAWVETASGTGAPGDLHFDQRIRLPDGTLVTWDAAIAMSASTDGSPLNLPPGDQMVALVVPGLRYRSVELREVGALAGGSLVALGIAGLAVRRRRPG